MKRVALILFFLFVWAFLCPTHSQAALRFFIDQDEVELDHPLVLVDGNFMLPLSALEKHLGARVTVSAITNDIRVVFPDQTILMQVGAKSAQIGTKNYLLEVAPQLSEGEILVPIRFFADRLNLTLGFDEGVMGLRLEKPQEKEPRFSPSFLGRLVLDQEEKNEVKIEEPNVEELFLVQDLQDISFTAGPRTRVFLDLAHYSGYQSTLLTNPDRLVVDLFGVEGEPLPPIIVDEAIVTTIRSSRFDEQTMRIVFDLKGLTGYRINPWPDGGLEVEFNYQLYDVNLMEDNGLTNLILEGAVVPELKVVHLENPARLVLDIQETTLMTDAFSVELNHDRISRLRVSQHLPEVVRVVLELKQPMAALPIEELSTGKFSVPLFAGTVQAAQAYLLASEHTPTMPVIPQEPVLPEGDLSGLIITVDPGHGGSDPGTIGYQGTFEKDIALSIARYLGEFLAADGAKVVYTRDQDLYVSIFERPQIATRSNSDLFVSIHLNSHIERGIARGTETLYRAKDPVSELFARTVQDEVVKAITLVDRRIWGRDDLAVFNGCKIPAIMVEVGFLDHPDEEVLLRAPGFQKVAAEGIYNGIKRFYLENKK